MITKINILVFCLIVSLIYSCEHYYPKPKGYFRIDMKPNGYKPIYLDAFKFSFYISKHSTFRKIKDNYYDIYYPDLNATIYLTHTKIKNNYEQIINDLNKITYKHVVKANSIKKKYFKDDNKSAVMNKLQGDVASNIQFYLTDSLNYFFSGSLYFYATPNHDSLKPCIDYVEKDIINFIESFRKK